VNEQPNILFIFADDHCYKAVNALHNKEVMTPHLDSLVERGTTFTHAYNMGAWGGAVCVASRGMLNTGLSVWRANELLSDREASKTFVAEKKTWSQLMSAAGYETYFSGKWHVKMNPEEMFDHVVNVRPGMPRGTPTGYNRPLADGTDPWDPADPKFGGFWAGGTHWSEVLANDGINFLISAAKRENPFFMYLAFNAPHDPRQAPQEYLDMYPTESIALPPGHCGEYEHNEIMGSGRKLRDEKLGTFPRTENGVRVNRREYYALITHMDAQIGRILEALEKSGKADNTYVIFSADHGLGVGHHGLFGKQNMFEHSMRVPFMVVGPDVKAAAKVSQPIYLQDVMATCLDLAGAEKPDFVEFNSVRPLLTGTESFYPAVYGAYTQQQRMVAKDGFKLILYPKGQISLLYDLKKDPEELENLAGNPENLPRMKQLFSELTTLQANFADKIDLATIYPELVE